MHEINSIDESFDLKRASDYHLSIQVGLDGFSFCTLDIHRKRYIVFRHIPIIAGKSQFLTRKVESIFDQVEELNSCYHSVSVNYSTNEATLIPKEYSTSVHLSKIEEFTFEIGRNEEARADMIHGMNYMIGYSYPKDLVSFLNRKYTDFEFRHQSVPILSSLQNQRNEKKNTILIDFETKYFRIIVLQGTQISLYNSFYFKNESDFLYYILNVCHTLHIDPELDEILISGLVADDSEYVRQLKKYLGNIQFLKPCSEFSYGSIFEKVQKHQFASLLNTYSCV